MALIKFNMDQFEPVPEGERNLEITEAKCVPSGRPTKMDVTFKDIQTGRILKNSYKFDISGSLMAMGFLCRTALELPDMGEFDTAKDTERLIGKIVKCEVVHTEGNQPREDGTLPVFANIKKVLELVTTSVKADDLDSVLSGKTTAEKVSPRASIKSAVMDDLD